MSTDIETLRYIETLGISAHKQVMDAYLALGYDLDTIAIAKGFYQPDSAKILQAYGVRLGAFTGEESDDRGLYRKLPQHILNEYVEMYYPGIDEANPQNRDITLGKYLEYYHPDWQTAKKKQHRSIRLWGLSNEEVEASSAAEIKKDK